MPGICKFSLIKLIILFGNLHFRSCVDLRCYKGSLYSYIQVRLVDDAKPETLLHSSCYSPNKDTVIYTHGFLQTIKDNSGLLVMQAYLDGGKTNVIGMDWSKEVSYPIVGLLASVPKSAVNVVLIGIKLGKFIVKLTIAGLSLARLHLIGFSIGAHCMGNAGKYVQNRLNEEISRVTGLDAGGPFHDRPLDIAPGLNAKSAKFVDVYHVNPKVLGTIEAVGTVDIWVNCNCNVQPGCENSKLTYLTVIPPPDICSHILTPKIFADTIRRSSDFIATAAPSCKAWSEGKETRKTTYLGDDIDRSAVGNYYININSSTKEYQTAAAAKENSDLQRRQLGIKWFL